MGHVELHGHQLLIVARPLSTPPLTRYYGHSLVSRLVVPRYFVDIIDTVQDLMDVAVWSSQHLPRNTSSNTASDNIRALSL